MSDTLQLLTLGVGDAFTEINYHTGFVVMAGEHRVMIDGPEPIRRVLREASEMAGCRLRLEDINDFVLTHLHADHASAWETICHYKRHFQGVIPNLHTSPEVLDVLWEKRLSASMGASTNLDTGAVTSNTPDTYYRAHQLEYDRENSIGPFQVSIRRSRHMIPTVGVIVRLGDARVGYACDTIFDPDHIAWLSQCDLIIHETNHGPHTKLEELVALPEAIRRKIRLVHYPDDFDVEGSPIPCLRRGQLIPITRAASVAH